MDQSDKRIDIVLVEDNEDHVELIKHSLEGLSTTNRILHFDNAEEAYKYLSPSEGTEKHTKPGLVLLDVNLPGMNGHDLLKRIKEDDELRSIPVVMLTTSSGESDRELAYRYHANSYLVKPIDFEQFEKMVLDLGIYWSVWNKRKFD